MTETSTGGKPCPRPIDCLKKHALKMIRDRGEIRKKKDGGRPLGRP